MRNWTSLLTIICDIELVYNKINEIGLVCHTYKHMREIGFVCDTKIFEKFSLACEIDNV